MAAQASDRHLAALTQTPTRASLRRPRSNQHPAARTVGHRRLRRRPVPWRWLAAGLRLRVPGHRLSCSCERTTSPNPPTSSPRFSPRTGTWSSSPMSQRRMVAAASARFSRSPRRRLSSAAAISASMSDRLGGAAVGRSVMGAMALSPSAQLHARAERDAAASAGLANRRACRSRTARTWRRGRTIAVPGGGAASSSWPTSTSFTVTPVNVPPPALVLPAQATPFGGWVLAPAGRRCGVPMPRVAPRPLGGASGHRCRA